MIVFILFISLLVQMPSEMYFHESPYKIMIRNELPRKDLVDIAPRFLNIKDASVLTDLIVGTDYKVSHLQGPDKNLFQRRNIVVASGGLLKDGFSYSSFSLVKDQCPINFKQLAVKLNSKSDDRKFNEPPVVIANFHEVLLKKRGIIGEDKVKILKISTLQNGLIAAVGNNELRLSHMDRAADGKIIVKDENKDKQHRELVLLCPRINYLNGTNTIFSNVDGKKSLQKFEFSDNPEMATVRTSVNNNKPNQFLRRKQDKKYNVKETEKKIVNNNINSNSKLGQNVVDNEGSWNRLGHHRDTPRKKSFQELPFPRKWSARINTIANVPKTSINLLKNISLKKYERTVSNVDRSIAKVSFKVKSKNRKPSKLLKHNHASTKTTKKKSIKESWKEYLDVDDTVTDYVVVTRSKIVHLQVNPANFVGQRNIDIWGCLADDICFNSSFTTITMKSRQCPRFPSYSENNKNQNFQKNKGSKKTFITEGIGNVDKKPLDKIESSAVNVVGISTKLDNDILKAKDNSSCYVDKYAQFINFLQPQPCKEEESRNETTKQTDTKKDSPDNVLERNSKHQINVLEKPKKTTQKSKQKEYMLVMIGKNFENTLVKMKICKDDDKAIPSKVDPRHEKIKGDSNERSPSLKPQLYDQPIIKKAITDQGIDKIKDDKKYHQDMNDRQVTSIIDKGSMVSHVNEENIAQPVIEKFVRVKDFERISERNTSNELDTKTSITEHSDKDKKQQLQKKQQMQKEHQLQKKQHALKKQHVQKAKYSPFERFIVESPFHRKKRHVKESPIIHDDQEDYVRELSSVYIDKDKKYGSKTKNVDIDVETNDPVVKNDERTIGELPFDEKKYHVVESTSIGDVKEDHIKELSSVPGETGYLQCVFDTSDLVKYIAGFLATAVTKHSRMIDGMKQRIDLLNTTLINRLQSDASKSYLSKSASCLDDTNNSSQVTHFGVSGDGGRLQRVVSKSGEDQQFHQKTKITAAEVDERTNLLLKRIEELILKLDDKDEDFIDFVYWRNFMHNVVEFICHHEFLTSFAVQMVFTLYMIYKCKQNSVHEIQAIKIENTKNVQRLMEQIRRIEVKRDVKYNMQTIHPYIMASNMNLHTLNEKQREQLRRWEQKKEAKKQQQLSEEQMIINSLFHNPQKQQDVYPLEKQIRTRTEAILSYRPQESNRNHAMKPTSKPTIAMNMELVRRYAPQNHAPLRIPTLTVGQTAGRVAGNAVVRPTGFDGATSGYSAGVANKQNGTVAIDKISRN